MNNDRGRWKAFVFYAIWREWRYHAHQETREKQRQARLHPKPSVDFGYGSWIAFFLCMSVLSLVWFLLFYYLSFMVFLGIIWIAFTWGVTYKGCKEVHDRSHDK